MTRPDAVGDAVLPLKAPDGTVYAYACATCRHIGGSGEMLIAHDAEAIARCAETSKGQAERCCRCDACGVPTGRGISLSLWSRYCDECAKVQQAKYEAKRAAYVAETEAEAATPEGIRDAQRRAIAEAFFAGESVTSLTAKYDMCNDDVLAAIRGWAREVLDV